MSKANHNRASFTRSPHIVTRPFAVVQIDTFSGIGVSDGFDAILSISDCATHMAFFLPIKKTATATQLANIIFDEICIKRSTGCFMRIQTDRAKTFTSKLFAAILARFGTTVSHSATAMPTSQSIVERSHLHLIHYIRQFANEAASDWASKLDLAAYAFNCTPSSVTGLSPMQLLTGVNPQQPIALGVEAMDDSIADITATDRLEQLGALRRMAVDAHLTASTDTSLREDATVNPSGIRPGDAVFVHRSLFLPAHLRTEESCKADLIFLGPVKVLDQLGPNTYKLDMPAHFAGHDNINVRFLKRMLVDPTVARDQPSRPREMLQGDYGYLVDKIIRHRRLPDGSYEFFTSWRNYGPEARSWESLDMFTVDGRVTNIQIKRYITKHKLPIPIE